jgi:hypothetical protein
MHFLTGKLESKIKELQVYMAYARNEMKKAVDARGDSEDKELDLAILGLQLVLGPNGGFLLHKKD